MSVQPIETLLSQLAMLQKMIDLQVQSLRSLRLKRDPKSELLTKEKSDLEGKLMKFFAKQLVHKLDFGPGIAQREEDVRNYPSLLQLLFVVDIEENMIQAVSERCSSVEELCLFSDEKIRGIFYSHDDDKALAQRLYAQYRRLSMALKILRSYVDRLQNGEKTSELTWNSWFETVPDSPSPNIRASIASYLSVFSYSPTSDELLRTTYFSSGIGGSIPPSPSPARQATAIPRSKSDEANVGQKIHTESTSSGGSTSSSKSRYRVKSVGNNNKLKTKPINLVITPSPDGETDSDYSKSRSSSMSQSPRTPTANFQFQMGHAISHRFSAKQLLVSIKCDYCNRIMFTGLKCKECRFKCHKKCSRKAPPSCGLPERLERFYIDSLTNDGLHSIKRTNSEPSDIINNVHKNQKYLPKHRSHGNLQMHQVKDQALNQSLQSADSYSTASSTSSMSSSPFHSDSPMATTPDQNGIDQSNFQFPDGNHTLISTDGSLTDTFSSTMSAASTIKSEASTDTLILTESSSQSKSSNDTNHTSSTISCQDDCTCIIDDIQSQISDIIPQHVQLRADELTKQQKYELMMLLHERGSLMSEWVIPYQDIEIAELIGKGRVGKVYRAKWHGEVALKVLYLENPSVEEKNDFKYKVQVLRRTRHENLILFMGACMEPPTLAIVCSLCKGYTLHEHIHTLGNKFEDAKLISIIQQVAQGMSYLHARDIVHNDLKTKNIFLENNKIVITDFGLISQADVKVTNSTRPNHLQLPRGWLCYQAPEIVRLLDPTDPGCEVPYYSKKSDVYAFGSVWFELIAGMWPFEGQSSHTVIWMIGKGFKQPLNGFDITREAKDILSMIWAYDPDNRPEFKMLLKAFERLPKRKLIRSPSQPTYLTRSANALIL